MVLTHRFGATGVMNRERGGNGHGLPDVQGVGAHHADGAGPTGISPPVGLLCFLTVGGQVIMRGTYQPSPMCEFLGRPAPGESIDWDNLDWDALEVAEVASKTITYRCGHTGPIPRHITPFAAPAYRVWASANQNCGECFLVQEAFSAVLGESCGLSPLTGSYKQVRWAITIRKGRLEKAEAQFILLDGRQQKSLEKRLAVTEASWRINTRDLSLDEFAAFKLPPRRKVE